MLAAGGGHSSEYESIVFYHNNTPKWTETFKVGVVIRSCDLSCDMEWLFFFVCVCSFLFLLSCSLMLI